MLVISRLALAASLLSCLQAVALRGASEPPALSSEQIIARLQQENLRRFNSLKHLTGSRSYHIAYRGLGNLSADMLVEAAYDAPSTKTFRIVSESGSKLLRDKVLKKLLEAEKEAADPAMQRSTALSPDNYTFQLVGTSQVNGRSCYGFMVEPHHPSKFLYRGKIWIDAVDFAVVQIEAEPSKNPSFWIRDTKIHHVYRKVGDFWLPKQNQSVSTMKVGGTAILTIDYTQYKVSTGR